MTQKSKDIEVSLENRYSSTVDRLHRKHLGQFFTPKEISDVMARWINEVNPESILEPCLGTGILVRSLREIGSSSLITAHEIDKKVLDYCRETFLKDSKIELFQSDYLGKEYGPIFDGVIANPPYIRHHDFKIEGKDKARIESIYGKLPSTSNIYVYFVLKILSELKPNGRAAVIIPSDWLNSNFGRTFKKILFQTGFVSHVLYYKNDVDPFEDNLSTATVLFIEKGKKSNSFKLAVISDSKDGFNELTNDLLGDGNNESISTIEISKLDPELKWGPIFEGVSSIRPDGWLQLGTLAKSRRGIATGANDYFHVSKSTLSEWKLSVRRTRACIGRSRDLRGLIFDDTDYLDLTESNQPVYLLDLDSNYENDRRYIEYGEEERLPERFLLGRRNPWFKQELRPQAQILVGVFGRDGVRFIWNRSNVVNLTTFHGLYLEMDSHDIGVIVGLLNSSLMQNHNRKTERSYGGGLQKVEPKDLLEMDIPDPSELSISFKDQLIQALSDADKMRRANIENWRIPLDSVVNSNIDLFHL